MTQQFAPAFVRVFAFHPDQPGPNPYLDIEDPRAIPACIVSFALGNTIYTGWYFPAHDIFVYPETDEVDPAKDAHVQAPVDSDIHRACVATMEHFRDTLLTGGTEDMEKVDYPLWATCPRQRRTRRLSQRTVASTSAICPTPPPAS